MNGSMAGIFVILLGVFVAIVGLRGTHSAVFGNLFTNTVPTNQTASNTLTPTIPGNKPPNNRGVFV